MVIVVAWLIVIALAVAALRTGMACWWIALGLWTPIAIWVVAFFRDPVRDGVRGDRCSSHPPTGRS